MSKHEERNLSIESCKMIQVCREKKGMSRVELAKKVMVSYSYIFNIETSRKRCVSYKILKNISTVLEMDLYDLLNEERPEKSDEYASFENIFFKNSFCIDGHELHFEQKLIIYEIIKILANPEIKKAKKLEHIISTMFEKATA